MRARTQNRIGVCILAVTVALAALANVVEPPKPAPVVRQDPIAAAMAATVEIKMGSSGMCSGVNLTSDGIILTDAHCFGNGTSEVRVVTHPGGEEIAAEVLWVSDIKRDLALVKIDAVGLPVVKIRTTPVEIGEAVFAVGHPYGLEWSVTQGHIAADHRRIVEIPMLDEIQTDLSINPGNSGGGLFDKDGQLVGINNVGRTGTLISLAVPVRVICLLVPMCRAT